MTDNTEPSATATDAPDWGAFRALFPVTERLVYMNTGWSGPSSRQVVEAMRRRAEREAYDGPTRLEVRREKVLLMRDTRSGLAGLIGADAKQIALLNTTTEGVNIALRGLDLGPQDEVLTCNLEHSSVMVPCYELRRRLGVAISVLHSSAQESADELARLFEEAITARTKLVVVSHISYNHGTRLPVERIVRTAHQAGAYVLIDAAQPVGQIVVNVRALNADFYAFPAHKFVLGPDGVGALYIRPDLVERVEPIAVAHGAAELYDFDGSFTPRRASMKKFEMTTHSGPLLAGVVEAAKLLQETGMPAVEARILELARRLVEGLQRISGATIHSPLDEPLRSGLVTFAIRDQDPNETCAALWQLQRVVGRVVNEKRIRLSMAPFNNEGDVDSALEAVEYLASRGLPPDAMSAEQYRRLMMEEDD